MVIQPVQRRRVSFSDLVEHVLAAPGHQLQAIDSILRFHERVDEARSSDRGFDPRRYQRFLRRIIDCEESGEPLSVVRAWVEGLPDDELMRRSFDECLAGYEAWRKTRRVRFLGRRIRKSYHHHGGLTIVVDPEVDLEIDGRPTRMKFYPRRTGSARRGETITKAQLAEVLHLLDLATQSGRPPEMTVGIFDLRGGALHRAVALPKRIGLVLGGTLDRFEDLCAQVESDHAGRKPSSVVPFVPRS